MGNFNAEPNPMPEIKLFGSIDKIKRFAGVVGSMLVKHILWDRKPQENALNTPTKAIKNSYTMFSFDCDGGDYPINGEYPEIDPNQLKLNLNRWDSEGNYLNHE